MTILFIRESDETSVAIGVALFITAGYWFTSSTSFANPAVTIARMFTNTFTGIAPASFIYFIFGQLIGSFIGLKIFKLIKE
jgi:glycerol uptake facilitator-like aquaporin